MFEFHALTNEQAMLDVEGSLSNYEYLLACDGQPEGVARLNNSSKSAIFLRNQSERYGR